MRPAPAAFTPQVRLDGPVRSDAVEYAVAKVEAALHHAPAPVLRVRLTLCEPDRVKPTNHSRVQVDVDLNGTHVGAHADGASLHEAVDLMQDKLRARLARARH